MPWLESELETQQQRGGNPAIVLLAALIPVLLISGLLTPLGENGGAMGAPPGRPAYADAAGDWPMARHDAAGTGYNAEERALRPPLRLKWSYSTVGGVRTAPVVAGGTVYAVSEDRVLYPLDAATGALKWSFQTAFYSTSPAVAGGLVYQGADDGALYALDPATGRARWSYNTGTKIWRSPVVSGGVVYLASGNTLYALDGMTGVLTWSYTATGPVESSPLLVDGIVYLVFVSRSQFTNGFLLTFYELAALDASSGASKWTVPWAAVGPAAAGDRLVYLTTSVYFRSGNSALLRALDPRTGEEKWNFSIGSAYSSVFFSSPAVAKGVVFVGASDLRVYALEAATGAVKWVSTTGGYVSSSPAVANGVVYVGSADGKVYALDAATGSVQWKYDTGAPVRGSPAVAGGALYVASDNGNVYAFESQGAPEPSIPNLSVTKAASKDEAHHGDVITYLVFLDNSGPEDIPATVTDTVPPGLSYIADTVAGGAVYSPTINSVLWSGTVPPGASTLPSLALQFRARVDDSVSARAITNTALVSSGAITVSATARTEIWRRQAFLPALIRGLAAW